MAESISAAEGERAYIVHADLRQFYDRVRPDLLAEATDRVRRDGDDPAFFSLAASVLDWDWHSRDERDVRVCAEQADLEDFTRVALPQGLVASGFFANVVLLPFDEALRAAIGSEIASGILLADACRYVDDLRVLIAIDQNSNGSSDDIKKTVSGWLSQILEENATGLALSSEKTKIAAFGGDERPLVRQSAKMNRIQSAVSGGLDALGGEEILDSIQGLMRAQEALSVGDDSGWRLSPVPDVRDETVARFGAARYRTTFRSIRPLFQHDDTPDESETGRDDSPSGGRLRVARTRRELDEDARSFPSTIDLESYRKELLSEAVRLVALPGPTIPWYLRQQALLFLAACNPAGAPVARTGTGPETRHYRELIRFLHGEGERLRSSDFAR